MEHPEVWYDDHRPTLAEGVYVVPGAVVVGAVTLGPRASVWHGAVLRGDVQPIDVGPESNVQDGAVLHGTLGEWPVVLGARVSIGHQATVHGATVEDGALIGIGARVLDGARVGSEALVAAGTVVREGFVVPPRTLIAGVPGVVRRELTERELDVVRRTPDRYLELARRALARGTD